MCTMAPYAPWRHRLLLRKAERQAEEAQSAAMAKGEAEAKAG